MNIARRQPNKFKRAEIGFRLKLEEEKASAQRRMSEGAKGTAPVRDPGTTSQKIAKQIGIAPRTFEYAMKVIKEAPEEIKELCRKEALGIRPAYGIVKVSKDVTKEEVQKPGPFVATATFEKK